MAGPERTPPHAYVPGFTPRHPEGAFDDIRATASAGMTPAALAATPAFREGLRYLRAGYFWEAHEVLEAVWLALPADAAERTFVQALIQIANGRLKLRMERPKAARRLAGIAEDLLEKVPPAGVMAVGPAETAALLDSLRAELNMQYSAQNG